MGVFVCIYVFVCICLSVYVYVFMNVYWCVCFCVYMCVCVCMFICVCTCVFVCMFVYMCVLYVDVCVSVRLSLSGLSFRSWYRISQCYLVLFILILAFLFPSYFFPNLL